MEEHTTNTAQLTHDHLGDTFALDSTTVWTFTGFTSERIAEFQSIDSGLTRTWDGDITPVVEGWVRKFDPATDENGICHAF